MTTATTRKHTPGPWTVDDRIGKKATVVGPGTRRRKGIEIAYAGETYTGSRHDIGQEEAEANARLIAAAPSLLEELKEARQYVGKVAADHDGEDLAMMARRRLERMDAAIAKAEGSEATE